MERLPGGARRWVSSHAREAGHAAAELLDAGWQLDELLEAVAAPGRNRREWPREFVARHGAEQLGAKRRKARADEERSRKAEGARQAATAAQQQLALYARFDALPAERRAALEARVVDAYPSQSRHPGMLRLLAIGMMEAQIGDAVSARHSESSSRAEQLVGLVEVGELLSSIHAAAITHLLDP